MGLISGVLCMGGGRPIWACASCVCASVAVPPCGYVSVTLQEPAAVHLQASLQAAQSLHAHMQLFGRHTRGIAVRATKLLILCSLLMQLQAQWAITSAAAARGQLCEAVWHREGSQGGSSSCCSRLCRGRVHVATGPAYADGLPQ